MYFKGVETVVKMNQPAMYRRMMDGHPKPVTFYAYERLERYGAGIESELLSWKYNY